MQQDCKLRKGGKASLGFTPHYIGIDSPDHYIGIESLQNLKLSAYPIISELFFGCSGIFVSGNPRKPPENVNSMTPCFIISDLGLKTPLYPFLSNIIGWALKSDIMGLKPRDGLILGYSRLFTYIWDYWGYLVTLSGLFGTNL